MEQISADNKLLTITADVVGKYLEKNELSPQELPDLIRRVHSAFAGSLPDGLPKGADGAEAPPKLSISQIAASITDDYIICFENNQRYRSLTRHLGTKYGLTPDAYRQKWGLPDDYPMTAKTYSMKRAEIARNQANVVHRGSNVGASVGA